MTTAPIINQEWNHTLPTHEERQYDLQLLTICGISVLGRWAGELGQYYVGWSALLGASKSQQQPYFDYIPTDEHYNEPQQIGYPQ